MAWFENDPGAVNVRGGILGPMTGSQKAAMLFAGLRDAVGNFSGRPTENLNKLSEMYGQQNYRQQVRQDRLDDKDATRKAEQDRREWELKNRQPDLKTAINPETNQMGQFYLDPTSRLPVWVKGVQLPGEAPKSRTVRIGTQDVVQEYDPISLKWKEVSRGNAFKPDAPDKGSWLAPVDETGPGGKMIRVRYNTNGERQVVPGAMPKVDASASAPNVDQAKNRQLYSYSVKQLPVAESHYDDLGDWKNQVPRAGMGAINTLTFGQVGDPGTVTGSKGRLAENAIKDIATNYTYSVSGATAPPKEVQDKIDLVMPKLTDNAEVRSQKKNRLREWVKSMQERGGYTPASPAPPLPPPPGQQNVAPPAPAPQQQQPQASNTIDPAAARAELARRQRERANGGR